MLVTLVISACRNVIVIAQERLAAMKGHMGMGRAYAGILGSATSATRVELVIIRQLRSAQHFALAP